MNNKFLEVRFFVLNTHGTPFCNDCEYIPRKEFEKVVFPSFLHLYEANLRTKIREDIHPGM